jgi:hypothetical protein
MQDKGQTQSRRKDGAAQSPDKADTPWLSAQAGDLLHQEFEVAFDRRDVRPRLIGLTKSEADLRIVGLAKQPARFGLPSG